MNKIFITQFEGETDFGDSVTEPNQCLSISDIMKRFVLGMDVGARTDGMYDESEDFEDDPAREVDMDFFKAEELAKKLAEKELESGNLFDDEQLERSDNSEGNKTSSDSNDLEANQNPSQTNAENPNNG